MPITRRHIKKTEEQNLFPTSEHGSYKRVSTLQCIHNRSILKQISGEDRQKELYLLGCNPAKPIESQQTCRKDMSPLFSWSKNERTKIPAWSRALLFICIMLAFAWLLLLRWRWRVPPKRRLKFNGLRDVTSQEMQLLILTVVRTWHPEIVQRISYLTTTCQLQAFRSSSWDRREWLWTEDYKWVRKSHGIWRYWDKSWTALKSE
jgi:hypothetical protein